MKNINYFSNPTLNKVSKHLSDCCLVLPSYPGLSNDEIATIVENIKVILNEM